MFRKFLGCLVIISIGLLLVACDGDYTTPTEKVNNVSISELVKNPTDYENTRVTVEGKVVEYLGRESWFTRVRYFRFGDESNSIMIQDKTGGVYVTTPFIFVVSTDFPEGTLKITGLWEKDPNGDYCLQIADVQIIGP